MGAPAAPAARRFVFVPTASVAPSAEPGTTSIVLDTAWTPGPDDRADLVPLRLAASAVLERIDLFAAALTRLDAWAGAAGMADRTTVDGVAWWFRAREGLWTWLHERLLWRFVLAGLGADDRPDELVIPDDEPALADVARALGTARGTTITFVAGSTSGPDQGPETASGSGRSGRGLLDRLDGLAGRVGRRARQRELERRAGALDERVRSLLPSSDGKVLVLSHIGLRQRVGSGVDERAVDPNLGAVIERLRANGSDPIVIGLGLDHRSDQDWPAIRSDPRLLPASLLHGRWGSPDDRTTVSVDAAIEALDGADRVPLDVDGLDLAPALVAEVRAFVTGGLVAALRQVPRVRRLLEELRPGAILLTHEGIRTSWLIAARDLGIPTFAVQHGIIYPTHPGYRHPRHPGLVLPSCTFVFGDYERRVLLEHGGYRPDEVVVSGSPRLSLDPLAGGDPTALAADRAAVRRELGVADGDRMVVVSTVFAPFARRYYYAHVLDRILGGPLPGIHVVFKLHPGENDEGPYRDVMTGLAWAGGYAPTPITVVRDVDLYRLLRAADAHLGLNSTVLTDAVIAGTPNLISVAQAYADLLGYVAAGTARPIRDVGELRAALAEPRPADAEARQAFIDAHFKAGDAAGRIVTAVLHPVVSIRPACPTDEALLLEWANEPAARRASGDRAVIPPSTHATWFAARLADPSSYRIWIGQTGDIPVGVIRFERIDVRSVEVSITVAPEARGLGLSQPLLRAGLEAAREAFDRPRFMARIRPDNDRSLALFERAGFVPVADPDGAAIGPVRLEGN